jgi:hypothetical protein
VHEAGGYSGILWFNEAWWILTQLQATVSKAAEEAVACSSREAM